MLDTVFITLLIVAICILLLGLRIFFFKGGKFPNTHISGSKSMREKGIGCVQSQDKEARKANKFAVKERPDEDNKTNN